MELNLQPNNTSFISNPARAAGQQQQSQPQAGPVPSLLNASDLSSNPSARNLQDYQTNHPIEEEPDPFNLPEYQPIKPGEPYIEKLANEAMNTKKLNICLKNARDNEELGDFKDAEKAYKKALKYTDDAEHYELYAACLKTIYLDLSRIPLTPSKDDAKEKVYKEKAAKAFYYLGALHEKDPDLTGAYETYKASHEIACHEVPLKALLDVARQIGEKGDIVDALGKLADFYAGKGDTALAIKMLEEAVQVEKSSTILEKLAVLCGQAGGEDSQLKVNETRIQQFELQISEDPKNISIYRDYAWFLKSIARHNEARAVKKRMDGLLQCLQQNLQTLQQKVLKQKTKIEDLKVQVKTFGEKVEFLEGQVIHLDFSSRTDIEDVDLIALLNKNRYIKFLNLDGCAKITNAGLAPLKGLTQLTSLNLYDCCRLTNAGLEHLKGLTQLTSLDLTNCSDLSDAGLEHLAGLTQLTSLNLYYCSQLTDASLQHLKALIQLTSLNLREWYQLTDAGLQHLAGLTQLTSLNLYECYQLTDAGLEHLADLTQLKSLDLYECSQLTDEGLRYLKGLTQLTTLNLSGCDQITDAGLRYLEGLSQLKTLNLGNSTKVTVEAKEKLKRQIPGLSISE